MDAAVRAALGTAVGAEVIRTKPLSGGDVNRAYAVLFSDGRELFAKTNRRPPEGMFRAEARGLEWLAAARAVRVPQVVAWDESFLLLELVRPGHPLPTFAEELGRGLAALHASPTPGFGLDHDNFIGPLPQSNQRAARWSDFYGQQRLEPQLRRASDSGLISPGVDRSMRRLFARLDALVGPAEPPARLHGDLWGGNVMCAEGGIPCLFDPAVYGGHREMDLAMMRLFGGFSARTFSAYEESFPLAEGHAQRVGLYQLYPLLVHVNLFGVSYLTAVESALAVLV